MFDKVTLGGVADICYRESSFKLDKDKGFQLARNRHRLKSEDQALYWISDCNRKKNFSVQTCKFDPVYNILSDNVRYCVRGNTQPTAIQINASFILSPKYPAYAPGVGVMYSSSESWSWVNVMIQVENLKSLPMFSSEYFKNVGVSPSLHVLYDFYTSPHSRNTLFKVQMRKRTLFNQTFKLKVRSIVIDKDHTEFENKLKRGIHFLQIYQDWMTKFEFNFLHQQHLISVQGIPFLVESYGPHIGDTEYCLTWFDEKLADDTNAQKHDIKTLKCPIGCSMNNTSNTHSKFKYCLNLRDQSHHQSHLCHSHFLFFRAQIFLVSQHVRRNEFTLHKYEKIIHETKPLHSWQDASILCHSQEGVLPVFRSEDELFVFLSMIKSSKYLPVITGLYIGLHSAKGKVCVSVLLDVYFFIISLASQKL